MSPLFIGVMSGTSLDGADAAVVDFSRERPHVLAFASLPFKPRLREHLIALSHGSGESLELAGAVSIELADIYSAVVRRAMEDAQVAPRQVAAIGCHGQTVRHRPDLGFTLQLNDAARLAEATGIDVVADFRRRDMAAGGQGAPLVPAFHDAIFRRPDAAVAVVNIGGIANVTALPPGRQTLGFDTGPGNVLLDAWAKRHLGAEYDVDGRWARSGAVDPGLLGRLMEEPYLSLPPPKSTGRELFHLDWLDDRLDGSVPPEGVQATLLEFTARTIAKGIETSCPDAVEVYLCGGGARNPRLVERLAANTAGRKVEATDALGVPSGHVEAMAFAWLAMKCLRREAIDMSAITGARGPRILGCIYPS